MTRRLPARVLPFALAFGLLGGAVRPASAQVYLSPIVGYDFGGDAGCPSVTNCKDKNLNLGIAFGNYGDLFGVEEEFAYAKDFFGDAPTYQSSVATLMSNLLICPDVGSIKPYALVGIGLIKSNVEFGDLNSLTSDLNTVAWDLGGGITAQFNTRFGVRTDVRFFKAMKDFELFGVSAQGSKLKFSRIAAGLQVFF